MFLLRELALRVRYPFKRERLCKQWPDFTLLDIGDQVGENRLIPCGAADQGQVLQIKITHVECYQGTANGARRRIFTASFQHLEHAAKVWSRHVVNNDVNGFLTKTGDDIIATGDDAVCPDGYAPGASFSFPAMAVTAAPRRLANCTTADPTPPDAPATSTWSPLETFALWSMFSAVP